MNPRERDFYVRAFDRGEWASFTITIGRTDWHGTVASVDASGTTDLLVLMTGVSFKFREAMARGDFMDNGFDSGWSLRGSAAALRDLDECRKRLGAF